MRKVKMKLNDFPQDTAGQKKSGRICTLEERKTNTITCGLPHGFSYVA
jgi:hypothetical protein